MSEQSRTPAGSPNGGQFAEALHAESSVELDDDDGLGWDGSFHAVPQFASPSRSSTSSTEHPPPDSTVFKLRRLRTQGRRQAAEAGGNPIYQSG